MLFASGVCSRLPAGAARRTVVTLLSLAVSIVMLGAQPPATPARPDTEAPTFRQGIDLITVDVVVTDRDGQPVRTLTVDDFQVYEDGRLAANRDLCRPRVRIVHGGARHRTPSEHRATDGGGV